MVVVVMSINYIRNSCCFYLYKVMFMESFSVRLVGWCKQDIALNFIRAHRQGWTERGKRRKLRRKKEPKYKLNDSGQRLTRAAHALSRYSPSRPFLELRPAPLRLPTHLQRFLASFCLLNGSSSRSQHLWWKQWKSHKILWYQQSQRLSLLLLPPPRPPIIQLLLVRYVLLTVFFHSRDYRIVCIVWG